MSTTSWYSSSKGLAVLPLQQQNVAFPVAEDGAASPPNLGTTWEHRIAVTTASWQRDDGLLCSREGTRHLAMCCQSPELYILQNVGRIDVYPAHCCG
jgi:hypothetical protein